MTDNNDDDNNNNNNNASFLSVANKNVSYHGKS